MNRKNAADAPHGYLLPEEGFAELEKIRDQLFTLAGFIFAATSEEEDTPLHIQRSHLAHCFERFGIDIDEVLGDVKWPRRTTASVVQTH
jgi:hypothetical protein